MKITGEECLKKITLGKTNYIHKTDEEYDYLINDSNNKIKITIKFTKDPEKNKLAMNGLKTFFTGISS
ncbi:hypothetical protein [Niallia sp.]|uniref:hypothetical protein n=1 Tax=Niallia sp. TaxID=2837523 RepID=UPI00289BB96E|nr:hypothetical protein [Niallia sp.]